jgi:hypothetical protein
MQERRGKSAHAGKAMELKGKSGATKTRAISIAWIDRT